MVSKQAYFVFEQKNLIQISIGMSRLIYLFKGLQSCPSFAKKWLEIFWPFLLIFATKPWLDLLILQRLSNIPRYRFFRTIDYTTRNKNNTYLKKKT